MYLCLCFLWNILTFEQEHPWVTSEGEDPLLPVEENTAAVYPTQAEIKSAFKIGIHTFAAVAKAVKSFKSISRRNSFAKPERRDTLNVPGAGEESFFSRRKSIDLSHDLNHDIDRMSIDQEDRKEPRRMDSAVAVTDPDEHSDEEKRPQSASAPAIAIDFVDSPTSETFDEPKSYAV